MQLARPRPTAFAGLYQGFQIIRHDGRYYALRDHGEPVDLASVSLSGCLSAATAEDLESLIDQYALEQDKPQRAGQCDDYEILEFRGAFYGVPRTAGTVDLTLDERGQDAGIVHGRTAAEVQEQIRKPTSGMPVEFAGWLPAFEPWGNCGRHPQFKHTDTPPAGYCFTRTLKPWRQKPGRWQRRLSKATAQLQTLLVAFWMVLRPFFGIFRGGPRCDLRSRWKVLAAIAKLFWALRQQGVGLRMALQFIRTRHYQSQLLIADNPGLIFLTSMPYTYGQNPWVIEIEDPTTLFYPFIQNGNTARLDLKAAPCFPAVKTLLEADACKGILTHMRSTARMVEKLFDSDIIRRKVCYTPLGVRLPGRWQKQEPTDEINLLFINSWCQISGNFFLRGGLDVLEAFAILRERYPKLRLTVRSALPVLDARYRRIMEEGWVRVIDRFLPGPEMEAILADSHIFLLPAARVHIVSLLQAMSYGLAVVTSDGWGIEEYVTHERNGLIVGGRYGKVSWADENVGMLRENYRPMYRTDPDVVDGLVEAVSRLIEDHTLRQRLGRTARQDVETTYNLERWNQGLKHAFDQALGISRTDPPPVNGEVVRHG